MEDVWRFSIAGNTYSMFYNVIRLETIKNKLARREEKLW